MLGARPLGEMASLSAPFSSMWTESNSTISGGVTGVAFVKFGPGARAQQRQIEHLWCCGAINHTGARGTRVCMWHSHIPSRANCMAESVCIIVYGMLYTEQGTRCLQGMLRIRN